MISSLIVFLSLFWLVLLRFKMKNRTYVSSQIDNGSICYSCKEDIDTEKKIWETGTRQLCTSCKRDQSLEEIIGHKHLNRYSIDSFLSKDWMRKFIVLTTVSIAMQFLNIFTHSNIIGISGAILLFMAHAFNYLHFMKISRPNKKTQS